MNAPDAFYLVRRELARAVDKFRPMASPHEGYAVILEEVDELWDAVKRGNMDAMREEAVQVAAMAVRFLVDCVYCDMGQRADVDLAHSIGLDE